MAKKPPTTYANRWSLPRNFLLVSVFGGAIASAAGVTALNLVNIGIFTGFLAVGALVSHAVGRILDRSVKKSAMPKCQPKVKMSGFVQSRNVR